MASHRDAHAPEYADLQVFRGAWEAGSNMAFQELLRNHRGSDKEETMRELSTIRRALDRAPPESSQCPIARVVLVAKAAAGARCRRDFVARRRQHVPEAAEGVHALPVRVAGLLVGREEVERVAVVGDLRLAVRAGAGRDASKHSLRCRPSACGSPAGAAIRWRKRRCTCSSCRSRFSNR